MLEQYWDKHRARDSNDNNAATPQPVRETPLSSPSMVFKTSRPQPGAKGHVRNRSASDGAALIPAGHRLSPYHPAWSLTSLLDTFGPLIFAIHRAALLRKRILISTHAPVHQVCNFGAHLSTICLERAWLGDANGYPPLGQYTIFLFSPTFPYPLPTS
jgi:hypothetical protein